MGNTLIFSELQKQQSALVLYFLPSKKDPVLLFEIAFENQENFEVILASIPIHMVSCPQISWMFYSCQKKFWNNQEMATWGILEQQFKPLDTNMEMLTPSLPSSQGLSSLLWRLIAWIPYHEKLSAKVWTNNSLNQHCTLTHTTWVLKRNMLIW